MSQKIIERNALTVGAAVTSVYTLLGMWAYLATGIRALFLDFFFSLLGLASSFGAIAINKVSRRRTAHYPHGLYFLEPLYAVLKSLLTLALLGYAAISAAISAAAYFTAGEGTPLYLAPVLPYTAFASALCFALGFYNFRQNRRIGGISTILQSECRTNIIDGLQSLGIGIGAAVLYALGENAGSFAYTGDFFITVLIAVLSVPRPIKMLVSAFFELSGAAVCGGAVSDATKKAVSAQIPGAGFEVYKVGTAVRIFIFPKEPVPCGACEKISTELSREFEDIEVVICI